MNTLIHLALAALAASYLIQWLASYYSPPQQTPAPNKTQAIKAALASTWRPITFSAIVTLVGLLELTASSNSPELRGIQATITVGILSVWLLSLTLWPLLLFLLPLPTPRDNLNNPTATRANRLEQLVSNHPRPFVISGVFLLAFGMVGLTRLAPPSSFSVAQPILYSLLAVALSSALIVRSFSLGLMATLPVGLALLLIFALMGWLGLAITKEILVVAAITLALTLNFAIQSLYAVTARPVSWLVGLLGMELLCKLIIIGGGIGFASWSHSAEFLPWVLLIGFGLVCAFGASVLLLPALVVWFQLEALWPSVPSKKRNVKITPTRPEHSASNKLSAVYYTDPT